MNGALLSQSRRNLVSALVTLGLAAGITAAGTAPTAAVTPVTYGITPTAGPAGTLITYTGTGCPHTDAGGRDGAFVLVTLPSGNFGGQTQSVFRSASDGTFTGTLAVPQDLAPSVYDTGVSCYGGGSAGWADGKPGPTFTVTPGAPVLTFARAGYSVQENSGSASVMVSRSGDASGTATVDYAATAGTASADVDFTPGSGTLSFASGETSKSFSVAVLPDSLPEGAETIHLTLSNPTGGASLSGGTSTLTIGVSDQQPDAEVSTAASTGFIGNDVYNSTGVSQTRTLTARRTTARSFYVRVRNDGNVTDVMTLRGSHAAPGSSVRYYAGTTTTNVTTAMRSRTGRRISLAPGRSSLIRVRIQILSTAAIGSRKPATVSATWTGDGTRVDVAKAVVKVVR